MSSDTNESSNDEDSKMKSYITWQLKKFMKNVLGLVPLNPIV